ncbi:CatB-related O-acetyltransferase [Loktanella sp. TSTF-M6]|uniref:CatB-related O-acetyltransferase n=1 Tax=Loktanella gaetbuli TaxID=2881335 RepID=A0ABS8BUD1_9RHOB|nr:CatB-related O-acetyltransferase [Loktanella gaetbuli]MCB5199344.1 CatB-related O-acetyltransferase [Loktanella gaetbuli]
MAMLLRGRRSSIGAERMIIKLLRKLRARRRQYRYVSKSAKLEWPVSPGGAIIKDRASIGRYTYLKRRTRVARGTRIGRYCTIAMGVDIGPPEHPMNWMSVHSFQYNTGHFQDVPGYDKPRRIKHKSRPRTVIGNDVWIGAKVIVRRGVKVGNGAILGAGSFVNKDVPPYAVVGGIPARVIRYRFDEATIARFQRVKWWTLTPQEMDGVTFNDVDAALDQIERIKAGSN